MSSLRGAKATKQSSGLSSKTRGHGASRLCPPYLAGLRVARLFVAPDFAELSEIRGWGAVLAPDFVSLIRARLLTLSRAAILDAIQSAEGSPSGDYGGAAGILVLLHQEIFRRIFLAIGAAQHGHRGSLLTRAAISRRRTVAIEFGMCRSGRRGGASGSVTVG